MNQAFSPPSNFTLNHSTVFVDGDFNFRSWLGFAPTPLVWFLSFFLTPHGLVGRCVATLGVALVALIVAACFRSLIVGLLVGLLALVVDSLVESDRIDRDRSPARLVILCASVILEWPVISGLVLFDGYGDYVYK